MSSHCDTGASRTGTLNHSRSDQAGLLASDRGLRVGASRARSRLCRDSAGSHTQDENAVLNGETAPSMWFPLGKSHRVARRQW
jgi:hypothetical protein